MIAIKVYGYFIRILILIFFSENKKYSIALSTLFNSHSYRIPNKLNKQKAPFVYLNKSFRLLFSNDKSAYTLANHEKAMYCIKAKHADFCVDYGKQLGLNVENMNVIVRDIPFTENLSFLDKLIIVAFNSFASFIYLIVSFFKKDSNKLAIVPLELTESAILLSNLLKFKTEYVYFFSAFEKDANWTALLMQKHHIFCHKIPSSNPIKNFYPKVIADKFSFTAPFQPNEYPALKDNWLVDKFDMWPNFGFQNLSNYTIEQKGSAPANSIGIFTRGIWLRKLRGDSFLGVGEDKAEELMLDYIKTFLLGNKQVDTVYVLMHPTEKSTPEQYEKSKSYYLNFFEGVNIKFIESTLPSYQLFNLFDVGIASLSSVVFERLFCGYKCLLAPINLKVKLYEDENLEKIIANTKEEFFSILDMVINTSDKEYFSKFGLSNYRLNKAQEIK